MYFIKKLKQPTFDAIAILLTVISLTTCDASAINDIKQPESLAYASGESEPIQGRLAYADQAYSIQIGDSLSVSVYNQPDLSNSKTLVRSDGYASFLGAGELLVAGKTVAEVTMLLEKKLSRLVKSPYITVAVDGGVSPTIYLAGAVMKPGAVQPTPPAGPGGSGGNTGTQGLRTYRLSNFIAAAGGVRLNADLSNVLVLHNNKPAETLNLWHLIHSADNSADIVLQNGDSVYIPELNDRSLDDKAYSLLLRSSIGPQAFPVRVIGEVKTPGVYMLDSDSPYINSGIAKSGGSKYGSEPDVVAVRRFSADNKFTTLYIDTEKQDFMLRPNDIVYVPSKDTYKAGRFATNVANILSPFTNLASSVLGYAFLLND
ncbi:MAG: polysaccharide biosynthesis/export family protein [Cyanobacteria bacterium P01_H01_bin.74]